MCLEAVLCPDPLGDSALPKTPNRSQRVWGREGEREKRGKGKERRRREGREEG